MCDFVAGWHTLRFKYAATYDLIETLEFGFVSEPIQIRTRTYMPNTFTRKPPEDGSTDLAQTIAKACPISNRFFIWIRTRSRWTDHPKPTASTDPTDRQDDLRGRSCGLQIGADHMLGPEQVDRAPEKAKHHPIKCRRI